MIPSVHLQRHVGRPIVLEDERVYSPWKFEGGLFLIISVP